MAKSISNPNVEYICEQCRSPNIYVNKVPFTSDYNSIICDVCGNKSYNAKKVNIK
jgi:hypothetical protein